MAVTMPPSVAYDAMSSSSTITVQSAPPAAHENVTSPTVMLAPALIL